MYINLHVLFSVAAGNPNTDETGAPKTAQFGGCTRGRIASQALMRPKRLNYEHNFEDVTVRSRNLPQHVTDDVATRLNLKPNDPLRKTILADADSILRSLTTNSEKTDKKQQAKDESDTENGVRSDSRIVKETPIFLSGVEIANLTDALTRKWGKGGDKKQEIKLDDVLERNASQSLSIALLGRMFANAPEFTGDSALSRSHALTTHAIEPDIDLITVAEELNINGGSAFMGQNQFYSAVFYWHASINVDDLGRTWRRPADRAVARERLIGVLEALLLQGPTGREKTTAISSLPRMVIATPATVNTSYQGAFESPVQPTSDGYLLPSQQRLLRECEKQQKFTPKNFPSKSLVAVLDDEGLTIPKNVKQVSLDSMIEQIADMILAEWDAAEAAA